MQTNTLQNRCCALLAHNLLAQQEHYAGAPSSRTDSTIVTEAGLTAVNQALSVSAQAEGLAAKPLPRPGAQQSKQCLAYSPAH